MRRFAVVVFAVLALLATRPALAIGFQWGMATDGDEKPLQVAIWYPCAAPTAELPFGPFRQSVADHGAIAGTGLPLVVMSHGTGGSLYNSFDTAVALAQAGFVVAALTHTGDNYQDHSVSFTRSNFANRPRHVSRVIDYMLRDWSGRGSIDPARIGVVGHSAGGATALSLIGGRLDWAKVVAFCRDNADDWGCRNARRNQAGAADQDDSPIIAPDRRIKAAVLMAPALTDAFSREGLVSVAVPIQLWASAKDEIVPDAARLPERLPHAPEFHVVGNGGHFAYLTPCNDILRTNAPEICADPAGFDRAAFLDGLHQSVAAFLMEHLPRP